MSWSRTLASELGAYGITVNTIAPGRINSAQIERLHPTEQSRADYIKDNIPAGYFGEPYDIGHLAAFLASPLRPLHQRRCDPGRRGRGAEGGVNCVPLPVETRAGALPIDIGAGPRRGLPKANTSPAMPCFDGLEY